MFGKKKDNRSFFEKLSGATQISDKPISSRHSKEEEINELSEEVENEGQLTVDVYQTPSDIIIKTIMGNIIYLRKMEI